MNLQALAGCIVYSNDVERALRFYREALGAPLALSRHGPVKDHLEASLGQTHFALLPGAPRIVPSFRVADLASALAGVEAAGYARVFGPMPLGEGKRLAAVSAPDGFEIRLVQIDD